MGTAGTLAAASQDEVDLPSRIDRVLGSFIDEQRCLWGWAWERDRVGALIQEFVLSGGKRLRPQWCYWAWRGAGGEDGDEIVTAAASLELLHAFCLIHDDVMDAAETRRGRASLHRAAAQTHRKQGWFGDGDRHGTAVAMLAGDLLLAWSDQLLHAAGFDQKQLNLALPVVHRMRSEVISGQYLDIRQQAAGADYTDALRVAHYKTGQYSVHRPLELGARLAGADAYLLEAYASFGAPLGEAFQLRDDVLGAVGDPATTGKSTLEDFREGKPTVLIALARSQADSAQAREIERLHGNPQLDADGAATLREILHTTGALQQVERLIDQRHQSAHRALEDAPLTEPARATLGELADAAVHRNV